MVCARRQGWVKQSEGGGDVQTAASSLLGDKYSRKYVMYSGSWLTTDDKETN
jgi:hypothetical protein